MHDLNKLFRQRIGISHEQPITFENIHLILEKIAMTIPFENLSIIENRTAPITKQNLIEKILNRNEGGMCYELNPILYLFLVENGLDVSLEMGLCSIKKNNNGIRMEEHISPLFCVTVEKST